MNRNLLRESAKTTITYHALRNTHFSLPVSRLFRRLMPWLLALFMSGYSQSSPPPAKRGFAGVPPWAKTAVWYQIFPERFRNGDPGNDPAPKDLAGGWPYRIPENWRIHPWTSDWYRLQPWEQGIDWRKVFSWAGPPGQNFYIWAGLRRYGGDLQGVLDKLDYLQELGITAIYFNPLFESPSLHKYDAAMYHHIDNNFGPDPARDRQIWAQEDPGDPATWRWTTADTLFLGLIRECHRRGIRVIIDGVFNHVGNMFWAFRDVVARQQDSPYADWFIIRRWDDPTTPENEFDYQGWNGVKDLPELREDENGLVPPVREHLRAVVQRWMDPDGDGDPSEGIDGWRLDVAEKVNIRFWEEFRRWVRAINPEAYLVGEVWWENWPKNKMFNARPWLGSAFDGVMNYRFARAVKQFVIDRRQQISPSAFADSLRQIYRDYPWPHVLVCLNLMDSHDTDRLASQIVNPDRWYDHGANPSQTLEYDVRKPTAEERRKQRLVAALQMTLPGAPMIYYGDEAGLWGGDDPDCRKPMLWPEFHYQPERSHPFGLPRPVDSVAFDSPLFDWYRKMIALRRSHPVLSEGSIDFFLTDDEQGILGFRRIGKEAAHPLWVLVNSTGKPAVARFSPEAPAGDSLHSLLTGKAFLREQGEFAVPLPAYGVEILTQ